MEIPAVSEMHRDAAPAAPPAAEPAKYKDEPRGSPSNRSHYFLGDCCQEPPSKDAVSSYDHHWDCCGCPEVRRDGAYGPCSVCGCGCKLALCASNVACLCLPACAGAYAERVRGAADFTRDHQTKPYFDPYPAFWSEAKGLRGKCLWTAACCNLYYPFGNAGFACCGKICWTEEQSS